MLGTTPALTFEQARPYRLGLPRRTSSIKAHGASPDSALSSRYEILGEIASGGMASVLYGRLKGPAGFARAVAIKRLHPHIARDQDFVSMFIDEARICARLSHVNIVPTLDVIEVPSELCLVMEYVHGASLDVLVDLSRERNESVPVRIAVALIAGVLHGLHAAHETRGDHGEPLSVVHRDVSPQNVLVGEDGVARVLDFGIAKAAGKLRTTPSGEVKGKLAYMAPEQFRGGSVDRRVDVYGAATVLWEVLVGRPLFEGQNESAVVYRVLNDEHTAPSAERADVPAELDAIVLKGLARDSTQRFATAREMALALERTVGGASQSEVSEWVREIAGTLLDERGDELRRLQQGSEPSAGSGPMRALAARGDATRKVPPSQPPTPQERPTTRRTLSRRGLVLSLLATCVVAAIVTYARTRDSAVSHELRAPAAAVPPPKAADQVSADLAASAVVPSPDAAVVEQATPTQESTPPSERPTSKRDRNVRDKSSTEGKSSPRDAKRRESVRPDTATVSHPDRAQCSPPYWWSADGVKHYKRECL
jgi:serine/threonine protein kinase